MIRYSRNQKPSSHALNNLNDRVELLESKNILQFNGQSSLEICFAKNTHEHGEGEDEIIFAPFSVVKIVGQQREDIEQSRFQYPILSIQRPSATTDIFGVCLDAIAEGMIGRVAVGGLVWAKTDSGAGVAGTPTINEDYLTVGETGNCEILYSGSGYALVRLGTGGGGGGTSTLYPHSHQDSSSGFIVTYTGSF